MDRMFQVSGQWSEILSTVLLFAIGFVVQAIKPGSLEEICQTESFMPTCERPDEVVVIETAQYGRLKIGRCVTEDFGYLRCMHDVMPEVTSQCSGRRSCDIRIDDTAFKRATPCHKDLKSHLWVSYKCVRVVHPPTSCHYTGHTITVAPNHPTFIASLVTEETACGTADFPWVLEAGPGQQLNLTLYDFATTESPSSESHVTQSARSTCRVYATIREHLFARGATVCGGQAKVQTVFVSTSNRVEIRFLTKGGAVPQFLLKYEALGCADPAVSHGMRIRRLGETVSIGCGDNGEYQWQLTCVHNQWKGRFENCTTHGGSLPLDLNSYETVLPYATSVVIITVIAIVVVCVILTSGIVCVKWRLKHESATRYPVTELTVTQDYDYGQSAQEKLHPSGPMVALQSPQSVSEASTNEYATMRLLQRSVGCAPGYFTDPHSAAPSAALQYTYATDHIYESPETMRRSAEPQTNFVIVAGGTVRSPGTGEGLADLRGAGTRICQSGGMNTAACHRYESPSREQQLQQRTLANATGNYSL